MKPDMEIVFWGMSGMLFGIPAAFIVVSSWFDDYDNAWDNCAR